MAAHWSRWFRVAPVLAMVPLVAVGCSSGTGGTGGSKAGGGTVSIRVSTDWGVPVDAGQSVTSSGGAELAEAMYDRLVTFNYKTGQVSPYVAKSWSVTPNSVTFTLRKDVTCSDGTPVTPDVVKSSLERFVSPAVHSRWPVTVFGAGPYTITADDAAGTVTFAVPKPFNQLLAGFTWGWVGIMCPAGLAPGADYTKHSYGSGPYVFDSATQGVQYQVVKRPGWNWGPVPGASMPDRLIFKVITDETTTANLLVTGDLTIGQVAGADISRLDATPSLSKLTAHNYAPQTLQFNEDPARPTSDVKVRQAVATAIGAGSYAQKYNLAANKGSGVLSTNIQSNPGGYCYTDLTSLVPKPSTDAAKSVLISDGYTLGPTGQLQKGGKPLALTVLGTPALEGSGPEFIASQLTAMGAAVTLNSVDLNTFAQNFAKTNYDVIVGAFVDAAPVAANTANFFAGKPPSQGGNNRVNRIDPQLDSLVANAYGAPSSQACAAWKALNEYMLQNFIQAPMPATSENWYSLKAQSWSFAGKADATLDPSTIQRV